MDSDAGDIQVVIGDDEIQVDFNDEDIAEMEQILAHERSDSESESDEDDDDAPLDPLDFKTAEPPKRPDYFKPLRPHGPLKYSAGMPAGKLFTSLMEKPLDIMLRETNRHGQKLVDERNEMILEEQQENEASGNEESPKRKKLQKWKELSMAELLKFIGLFFLTGLIVKSDLKDYWSTDPLICTPIFGKVMPRDRFLQILSACHFVDAEKAHEEQWDDRKSTKWDPFHKIREFFESAFEAFLSAYGPHRKISIDEQVIPYKGHWGFRVLIKGKPNPVGEKVYSVCDAKTGYNLFAFLWCGKILPKEREGKNNTYATVWELLEKANLLHQGYQLFVDNYYTSRKLFEDLLTKGLVYCIGTVKKVNARGLPKWFLDQNAKMLRGASNFLFSAYCTLVNWRDRRNVTVLSTFPSLTKELTLAKRKVVQKDEETGESKWNANARINQPEILKYYNTYMGGVDHADQMLFSCYRHFRSCRWYMPVAFYVLKTALCNVHILKRGLLKGLRNNQWKRYTLSKCTKEVISHLLNVDLEQNKDFMETCFQGSETKKGEPLADIGNVSVTEKRESESESPKMKKLPEDKSQYDLTLGHFLRENTDGKYLRCIPKLAHTGRKQTKYYCKVCHVNMCDQCFELFHVPPERWDDHLKNLHYKSLKKVESEEELEIKKKK